MSKKLPKKILFIVLLISSFLLVKFALAESTSTPVDASATTTPIINEWTPPEVAAPQISTEDFFVDFSPENPGANTKVSADVTSYTFDVNRASVAWIMNGKIAGSGRNFSFITGELGSSTYLKVSVITPSKKTLSKSFTFQAAEVDLLWETSGYAPAPYRGKIMPVSKSNIKVTAIPQGIKTSSSNLIYEWKKNNKSVLSASGQGKRTFSFYAQESGEEIISVKVTTADASVSAKSTIAIPIGQPKILFYEEDPLEGPKYQKNLGNIFALNKPELILRAEPYFFSKRALPVLSKNWSMNGKMVEIFKKPNIINFSKPDQEKGTSLIKLSLLNSKNILEAAERTIQINFNQ